MIDVILLGVRRRFGPRGALQAMTNGWAIVAANGRVVVGPVTLQSVALYLEVTWAK